jgi:uncharacterized coiled-coil DUF342 family protein
MTIEVAILISGTSLAFALFSGIKNLRRNERTDAQRDASALTTVIVKLENIGNGITEIKSEITNVKQDQKEDHERLVKCEESTKSLHKRLDSCENYYKRLRTEINE